MSDPCLDRLQQERRNWRKNHPLGFHAKPTKASDGSLNLFQWEMGIPGKKGTIWEGGVYPVTLYFTRNYPIQPPTCMFPMGFYHVNVYPKGHICLSILSIDYRPSLTLREIAIGIQSLLNEPNPHMYTNPTAADWFRDKNIYYRKVKQQVEHYRE